MFLPPIPTDTIHAAIVVIHIFPEQEHGRFPDAARERMVEPVLDGHLPAGCQLSRSSS